jgi:hypothetical protein
MWHQPNRTVLQQLREDIEKHLFFTCKCLNVEQCHNSLVELMKEYKKVRVIKPKPGGG